MEGQNHIAQLGQSRNEPHVRQSLVVDPGQQRLGRSGHGRVRTARGEIGVQVGLEACRQDPLSVHEQSVHANGLGLGFGQGVEHLDPAVAPLEQARLFADGPVVEAQDDHLVARGLGPTQLETPVQGSALEHFEGRRDDRDFPAEPVGGQQHTDHQRGQSAGHQGVLQPPHLKRTTRV